MIMEFTGGDMSLMPEMMKFTEKQDGWDKEFKKKYTLIDNYLQQSMGAYITNLGYNPFEGV
jgi:hypothetical protein